MKVEHLAKKKTQIFGTFLEKALVNLDDHGGPKNLDNVDAKADAEKWTW